MKAKNAVALFILVLGLGLIIMGVLPRFEYPQLSPNYLSLIQGNEKYKFVAIEYSTSECPFTGVTASITTNQIEGPQGDLCWHGEWIGIDAWDQQHNIEFMQIGYFVLYQSGQPQELEAFWATNGTLDGTNYTARNIAALLVGSVHTYALTFDGIEWGLYFDNSLIHNVLFHIKLSVSR